MSKPTIAKNNKSKETKPKKQLLTPKQEAFIKEYISNGGNKTQAYIAAYDTKNMAKETIMSEACKLFNNPNVTTRYRELLDKAEETYIITVKEKRKFYRDIMFNDELKLDERLKASDLDSKLTGEYVDKHELLNNDIVINYNRVNANN